MSRDKVKVYKVTMMIVDHDRLGEDELLEVLEHTRYPNHCIAPTVMEIQTREVDWSDEHPLNQLDQQERAFVDLFVKDTQP